MIRSKKRVARRKRLRKEGRLIDLPSNVSVKQLGPFPRFPPDTWVGDLDTSVKVYKTKNIYRATPYPIQNTHTHHLNTTNNNTDIFVVLHKTQIPRRISFFLDIYTYIYI